MSTADAVLVACAAYAIGYVLFLSVAAAGRVWRRVSRRGVATLLHDILRHIVTVRK